MTAGTVYLLHLDDSIDGNQHYLGWTGRDVSVRVQEHFDGRGSKFMRKAFDLHIAAELVRTWEGTPLLEKALKKRKNHKGLCPICQPLRNKYERERRRNARKAANGHAQPAGAQRDVGSEARPGSALAGADHPGEGAPHHEGALHGGG